MELEEYFSKTMDHNNTTEQNLFKINKKEYELLQMKFDELLKERGKWMSENQRLRSDNQRLEEELKKMKNKKIFFK